MKEKILGTPLFLGIAEDELDQLLECMRAKKKKYYKNEYIYMSESPVKDIGIVLSGKVGIIREDIFGHRDIIGISGPGELFAEAFVCAELPLMPVSVVASEDTEVAFIEYDRVFTVCEKSCSFHSSLIKNMMHILAHKNINLSNKINCLSQGTLREKILSYLNMEASKCDCDTFEIPFSRQELADYLSVNRSALSRELAHMKEEGLIKYNRNRFSIIAC